MTQFIISSRSLVLLGRDAFFNRFIENTVCEKCLKKVQKNKNKTKYLDNNMLRCSVNISTS